MQHVGSNEPVFTVKSTELSCLQNESPQPGRKKKSRKKSPLPDPMLRATSTTVTGTCVTLLLVLFICRRCQARMNMN